MRKVLRVFATLALGAIAVSTPNVGRAQAPACDPIVLHWSTMSPGIGPMQTVMTLTNVTTGKVTTQRNTIGPTGGIFSTPYGQNQQLGTITFTLANGFAGIYDPNNGNPQLIATNLPGRCLFFCIQGWNPPAPYICDPAVGMIINIWEVSCTSPPPSC